MTVKDIAAMEGISVQSVYKRFKANGLKVESLKDKETGHFTPEGEAAVERIFKPKFKDFKPDFLDEWFYYEPEVEEIFGLPEHEIDKWLWENRNDVFFDPWLPEAGSKKRKIYDELNSKYGENRSVLGDKAL